MDEIGSCDVLSFFSHASLRMALISSDAKAAGL